MEESEPLGVAELVRRYRLASGLTQEELAERASLSARAIRALEAGDRLAPRASTLALLADALGLTTAERDKLQRGARLSRAVRHTSAPPAAIMRRPAQPMVGCARELALLDRSLMGDGPPLLLLAGEPGIGKSRFLEETVARANARGWAVLAGGCHRRSAQEPYAPCVEALLRFVERRAPTQLRRDLQGCGWLVRLLPELAERIPAPAPSWALPAEQERRLMFAAVAHLLANVAGPAGTLLVLDDLQWASADALDLLASLLRQGNGGVVRVVGAYRDTDVEPHDALPLLLGDLARENLALAVPLKPLDPLAAEQLLNHLLADVEQGTAGLRQGILARAGGVPFYLVSCAQEARVGALGGDRGGDGNEDEDGGGRDLGVPWSAAESIRQRVALLAAPAREVLSIASVRARQIRRGVLLAVAEALDHDEKTTLAALEALVRARLLVEEGADRYVFAHDLIHETVTADLGAARRATLHRKIGETLERLIEAEGPQSSAALAWHFAEAGFPVRALPYALLAGDRAEAVFAHGEAERHYRTAVRLAVASGDPEREAEALERLADTLMLLSRHEEAYTCLERATTIYRAAGNWERLAWATAQLSKAGDPIGRVEDSLRRLEDLFALLASVAGPPAGAGPHLTDEDGADPLGQRARDAVSLLTPRTAARLYLCLTSRYAILGRYESVYGPSDRTIQYARIAGDVRLESLAFWFRSEALRALGRIAEAAEALASAHESAVASGDLEALSVSLGGAAALHLLQGKPLAAREACHEALTAARQLGNMGLVGGSLLGLASCEFLEGNWDQARQYLEQAAELPLDPMFGVPALPSRALAVLDMLRADSMAGTQEPTETEYDAGDEMWLWDTAYSERDILDGNAADAAVRLRRTLAARTTDASARCALMPLLAWAELESGEVERAVETLAAVRTRADTLGHRMATVDVERITALVAQRDGRWDEAREALDRALAICLAMPWPYAEAKVRYLLGRLASARGAQQEAREQDERAAAISARLGERLYGARIERMLAGVGVVADAECLE